MKEKLLIIGAGGLGRMTLEIVNKEYDCFFVDDNYSSGETVCATKVVGNIKDIPLLRSSYKNFIVAIGNNDIREKVTQYCLSNGLKLVNAISHLSYVSEWASVGDGCIIFQFATIQNNATIGNGTVICSHSEIHHDSIIGNYCVIYPNSTVRTYAKVEDKVKCGSNVSIGNGCVISASCQIENGSSILTDFNDK